jgi:DnaJ like chaperone protein
MNMGWVITGAAVGGLVGAWLGGLPGGVIGVIAGFWLGTKIGRVEGRRDELGRLEQLRQQGAWLKQTTYDVIESTFGPTLAIAVDIASEAISVGTSVKVGAWLSLGSGTLKSAVNGFRDNDGDLFVATDLKWNGAGGRATLFFPFAALPEDASGALWVRVAIIIDDHRYAKNVSLSITPEQVRDADTMVGALARAAVAMCHFRGPLEPLEVRAIKDELTAALELRPEGVEALRRITKAANASTPAPDSFIPALAKLPPEQKQDAIHFLYAVASSDRPLQQYEDSFISTLAHAAGVAHDVLSTVRARFVPRTDARNGGPAAASWRAVLEVDGAATWEQVRLAYKRLAREYHPDTVASLPAGFQEYAVEKMKTINGAYEAAKLHYGVQ